MDESKWAKEPIAVLESTGMGFVTVVFEPGDATRSKGQWAVGKYELLLRNGSTLTFELPLDVAMLDPRKTYNIRLSVFEG